MNSKAGRLIAFCLTGTVILGGQAIAANASSLSAQISGAGMEAVINDTYAAEAEVSIIEYLTSTVNSEFENLAVSNVEEYVNIRESADEDSDSLGKLYSESVAKVIEEDGDWVKVESGTVTGYIKNEYLIMGEEAEELAEKIAKKVATVNTETLKVREEGNTESTVLTLVGIGEELTVKDETEEGWYEVKLNEDTGYVAADYVDIELQFKEAESREEEEARLEAERKEQERLEEEARREQEAAAAAQRSSNGNSGSSSSNSGSSSNSNSGSSSTESAESYDSGSGQSVASYAQQFVGNPYKWGGSSLTNGADCSGFVMAVYANFGVSLPHSSSSLRSQGRGVSYSEAQPGDIICYSGHVAIYIGGGQIVHASNAKDGIKISNATYANILAVRRIF